MQININCDNCGNVIYGAAFMRVDAASYDAHCTACKAIYRIEVRELHKGNPELAQTGQPHRSKYFYTYDEKGNKVPLSSSNE